MGVYSPVFSVIFGLFQSDRHSSFHRQVGWRSVKVISGCQVGETIEQWESIIITIEQKEIEHAS